MGVIFAIAEDEANQRKDNDGDMIEME